MKRKSKTVSLNLVVWLFLFLSISGCSEKSVDERFKTPRSTYDLWLESSLKNDMETNMACITKASRKLMEQMEGKKEEIFMRRMIQASAVFKSYSVAEEKIEGDKAILLIREPKSQSAIVIPFKSETDGWKVDLVTMFGGNW